MFVIGILLVTWQCRRFVDHTVDALYFGRQFFIIILINIYYFSIINNHNLSNFRPPCKYREIIFITFCILLLCQSHLFLFFFFFPFYILTNGRAITNRMRPLRSELPSASRSHIVMFSIVPVFGKLVFSARLSELVRFRLIARRSLDWFFLQF